jgi:hypothetical protein
MGFTPAPNVKDTVVGILSAFVALIVMVVVGMTALAGTEYVMLESFCSVRVTEAGFPVTVHVIPPVPLAV